MVNCRDSLQSTSFLVFIPSYAFHPLTSYILCRIPTTFRIVNISILLSFSLLNRSFLYSFYLMKSYARNLLPNIHFLYNKSLNDSCPPPLRNLFKRFNHGKDTRGNGSLLIVPRVETEAGRKTLTFQGALIFNGLSSDHQNESFFVNFKRKIDNLSFAL